MMLSLLVWIAVVSGIVFLVKRRRKATGTQNTYSSWQEDEMGPEDAEHADETPSPNPAEDSSSTTPVIPDREKLIRWLVSSNQEQQIIALTELENYPMQQRAQIEWEASQRCGQSYPDLAKQYVTEAAMNGCGQAQFRLAMDDIADASKDSDSAGIIEAEYWLGLAEENGIAEAASKQSQIRDAAYQWRAMRMAHFMPMIFDCISGCDCSVDAPTDEETRYYKERGSILFKFHSEQVFRRHTCSVVHSGKLIWHQNGVIEVITSLPIKQDVPRNAILRELSGDYAEAYYDEMTHSVVFEDSFMAYTYRLCADTIRRYIDSSLYGASIMLEDHPWLDDVCCKTTIG